MPVSQKTPLAGLRILVTGGAGFLGQAMQRELLEAGVAELRLFDLRFSDGEPPPGVERITGDVCAYDQVLAAATGMDAVIHSASLVDWGQTTPEHLAEVNVGGAENAVRAAREAGVRALVYTSTMDVVCGVDPVVDADETMPFPARFTNDYARTKALAEQHVLEANDAELRTCALRPCGMFGEGDPYHVENVLRIVKDGGLPVRPGDGSARFQHVYVGNVAHAHRLAVQNLLSENPGAAGEAYFVTDDCAAVNFFEFMEPILEALGYSLPPKTRRMPYPIMLAVGASMEAVAALCSPFFRMSPTLTRSSVRFVCHDHTFNGDKVRRDLGYAPVYKEEECIARTIEYFRKREEEQETT
jgi:nucleoside-diphosphate-sugar epimerase